MLRRLEHLNDVNAPHYHPCATLLIDRLMRHLAVEEVLRWNELDKRVNEEARIEMNQRYLVLRARKQPISALPDDHCAGAFLAACLPGAVRVFVGKCLRVACGDRGLS